MIKEQKNNTVPFTIRLPADLHRDIVEIAASERRSIQSQILFLLEQGIELVYDDYVEAKKKARTR